MTDARPIRLLCGADTDELLEQVADRPDEPSSPHQRGCVYCRAAMAEFARLWAPLREAAAEPIRAPQALRGWVLDRIRAAVETPDWAVLAHRGGLTPIVVDVVVKVVRQAAVTIPGVRAFVPTGTTVAAKSKAAETDTDRNSVRAGVSGMNVAVLVTVAADYRCNLRVLGHGLAGNVLRRVDAHPHWRSPPLS